MTDLANRLRAILPLIDTIRQEADSRLADPPHRIEYPQFPALPDGHIRAFCFTDRSNYQDVAVPADQCARLREFQWHFMQQDPAVIFRFHGILTSGGLVRQRITIDEEIE